MWHYAACYCLNANVLLYKIGLPTFSDICGFWCVMPPLNTLQIAFRALKFAVLSTVIANSIIYITFVYATCFSSKIKMLMPSYLHIICILCFSVAMWNSGLPNLKQSCIDIPFPKSNMESAAILLEHTWRFCQYVHFRILFCVNVQIFFIVGLMTLSWNPKWWAFGCICTIMKHFSDYPVSIVASLTLFDVDLPCFTCNTLRYFITVKLVYTTDSSRTINWIGW